MAISIASFILFIIIIIDVDLGVFSPSFFVALILITAGIVMFKENEKIDGYIVTVGAGILLIVSILEIIVEVV